MLGFPGYLLLDTDIWEKKRKLLLELVNAVRANQNEINDKVSNMTMAQEYFKRAVVCVGVLAALLLIETIVKIVPKN